MDGPTETLKRADEITAARTEVEQQAKDVGPNETARSGLGRKLLDSFLAKDIIAEETRRTAGKQPLPREAREVKRALAQILEAVKQGLIRPEGRSADLVKKLDETLGKRLTDQTAGSIYPLIREALQGEIDPRGLETQFDRLRQDLSAVNPAFVRYVAESVVDLAREGKLDTSEEEARERFKVEERQPSQPGVEEIVEQGEDISAPEAQKMQDIYRNIHSKVTENLSLPETDPNKLTDAERTKVSELLYHGGSHEGLGSILRKIGATPEDAAEYRQLQKKLFTYTEKRTRGTGNVFLDKKFAEALEEFRPDKVKDWLLREGEHGSELATEARQRLKKMITEYYYYLFQEFDRNPEQLWGQIYNPLIHGNYISNIQGLVSQLTNDELILDQFRGNERLLKEYRDFMSGMIGHSHSLVNYGETFHDLPIHIMDPGITEKLPGFLTRLFPSETASFLDDPVLQIAQAEVERHIRERIALNGNRIPSDIFGGRYSEKAVQYQFKDQRKIRESIERRLRTLRIDYESWELERAISYSRGIGIMNLRDIEVMGTADSAADYKGIPDIVAKLWQRHRWGQGRGGMTEEQVLVPEIFTMDVIYNPEQKSLGHRLFKKRSWIPQQIYDKAHEKLRGEVKHVERVLLDREGAYQELMNVFNIGSLVSRAGWRVDSLTPKKVNAVGDNETAMVLRRRLKVEADLDYDHSKDWEPHEWDKFYDIIVQELGVGGLWFYAAGKVETQLKNSLALRLGKELEEGEFGDYYPGEKAFEKIFEVVNEKGVEEMLSLHDLRVRKDWVAKGELFQRLFLRSPGDFIMNLIQLVPDIIDPDNDIWENPKDSELGRLTVERWGEEGYAQLKWISENWFKSLFNEYNDDPRFSQLEGKDKKDAILSHFFEQMGTALERAKSLNKTAMTEDDIIGGESPEDNEKLRRLVFGSNGIITHFRGLHENFGDGTYKNLGNYGFFYRTGRAWKLKEGDVNPNTTDLNYFKVYREIAKAGESVIRRLQGDVHTWDQVVSAMSGLDDMLLDMGSSKDPKAFYELHRKIHSLKGIVGPTEAKRANYLLASLVASYFWEHKATRLPFGVLTSIPAKMLLRKGISVSKLHGGIGALSWNDNEIRNHFRALAYDLHVINQKGAWSYEAGQIAFDAKTDAFVLGNALPSILTVITLFLLLRNMRKAAEDEGITEKKR